MNDYIPPVVIPEVVSPEGELGEKIQTTYDEDPSQRKGHPGHRALGHREGSPNRCQIGQPINASYPFAAHVATGEGGYSLVV